MVSIRRAALIIAPLLGLIAPGTASAVDSCTFNATTRVVSIATDDVDVLSRSAGGDVLFNSAQCLDGATVATVANANRIDITANVAGDQNFSINHSIGPFGPGFTAETNPDHSEVEIEINLGAHNGGDILDIVGSPNNDTYRLGASGINLNVDPGIDDFDVTGPGAGTLSGNGNIEHFRFIPGGSNDIVNASPPNQTALPGSLTVFDGDGQNDQLTGGTNDIDLLDYGGAASGVNIDLAITGPQDTGAGTDQLAGFERLIGSNHDDTLIGDDADNQILGQDGIDRVEGRLGSDDLDGGNGIGDTLDYASAPAGVTVSLETSFAQDTVGAGSDSVDDFENLSGGPFADILITDDEPNVLTGGLGADELFANDGDDQLLIRDGVGDIADCGAGSDSVTADATGVDSFPDADCELLSFAPAPPLAQAPPPGAKGKKCKRKKKGKKRAGPAAKRKKCKRTRRKKR